MSGKKQKVKKCFLLFLLIFFLVETVFAKNKVDSVVGVSRRPDLQFNKIDDWNIEITGTNGLSDVQFIFIKSIAKNKIKNERSNIINNIEVVISGEPYKLKFKKSNHLNYNNHLDYLSTTYDLDTGKKSYSTGVLEDDYILEFELDKKSDMILPDSILLRSKRQLKDESSLRASLFSKNTKQGKIYPGVSVGTSLKIDSLIRSSGYEYGSNHPPYSCCYICLCDFSLGDVREVAEEKNREREQKRQERQVEVEKNNLITEILSKMGYRSVNSSDEAIRKGDMFVSSGSYNNPKGLVIKDFSFNGSAFSYLVAESSQFVFRGSVFYVLSNRQLQYTNSLHFAGESAICETLYLKYIGTDTYREGYTIKECKVFQAMDENEMKPIRDVIENPEKYRYLLK